MYFYLITDEKESLIKAATAKINQHQSQNKDEGKLSTKRKPMSERVKNCTEEEVEEFENNRLKELMTIVDLNLIKDKINDRLCIEEQESIEEEKCIIGAPLPQNSGWRTKDLFNWRTEIYGFKLIRWTDTWIFTEEEKDAASQWDYSKDLRKSGSFGRQHLRCLG